MYNKSPHASLRSEVILIMIDLVHVPNVGVMVVVASAAAQMEVGSVTKRAYVKHMAVLNGATIKSGVGIGVQRAERTGRIVAIQSLTDGLGAIVVDANTMSANRSATPRAVECHILRTVDVVHVGGDYVSRLVHAVVIDIFLIARNETDCGNKEGNCHQT
jgi:hypothetical protein